MILGPCSSSNNLHRYTWSGVKLRTSLMRFVWSVNIFMFWPHSIPLNSFSVLTMASSSILVTLYLRCVLESFGLKNTIGLLFWLITAPNCLLEVNLEDFGIGCIGQNYIFSDCSFYLTECSLMDLVSMPGYLFGPFCLNGFGLPALSNQWGERVEHTAPSCPEVTVILYHA